MSIYQPSFFDESERLAALSKLRDPLEQLTRYIDFGQFRAQLDEVFGRQEKPATGRRPYDTVLMFKILILQRLYNLSDEQAEFQITDRLSFTRFLELKLGSKIPDFSTVWRFREALSEAGAVKGLFERFTRQLEASGVIGKSGMIVDASFVEVPRQRNSRQENKEIKEGTVPPDWKNDPDKLSHKDVDARWTKKNNETFYGYKDHVRTDADTVLITDYVVTDAAVHDSQVLNQLVGKKDRGRKLWADSAYKSAATDRQLEEWKVDNQIHEKAARNRPLTKEQKAHNRQKSRIRCLVEHVFGHMETSMQGPELAYIGLKRIASGVGLANLAYNMCRFTQLIRLGRIPADAMA
jgi:transposase, IS5 family